MSAAGRLLLLLPALLVVPCFADPPGMLTSRWAACSSYPWAAQGCLLRYALLLCMLYSGCTKVLPSNGEAHHLVPIEPLLPPWLHPAGLGVWHAAAAPRQHMDWRALRGMTSSALRQLVAAEHGRMSCP